MKISWVTTLNSFTRDLRNKVSITYTALKGRDSWHFTVRIMSEAEISKVILKMKTQN